MGKRFVDKIPPKKKRKKGLIALLVIVLVIAALVGGALFIANHTLNKMNRVDKAKEMDTYVPRDQEDFEPDSDQDDTLDPNGVNWGSIKAMKDPDVKNILLIGQDRRPGETGRTRSDSMIVCSINKKTGAITLVSLMRDMYVPIPGYTDNRINAAYVFGGMSLLNEVILRDFGIVIDGNVEVDFNGFISAMRLIAPLDIELKSYEATYLNDWNGSWHFHEGVNAMDADQLLAYARIRHVGNADYERTERQRRVLTAAFQKLKGMGVSDIYGAVSAVLPSLTTDMSNGDIMSYASYLITARPTIRGNYRLPADGSFSDEIIRGMMVLVPDLVKNARLIQTYIYGKTVN